MNECCVEWTILSMPDLKISPLQKHGTNGWANGQSPGVISGSWLAAKRMTLEQMINES